MTTTIVWFRQDLRLADNPALDAAVQRGGPLLPIYILDEEAPGVSAELLQAAAADASPLFFCSRNQLSLACRPLASVVTVAASDHVAQPRARRRSRR